MERFIEDMKTPSMVKRRELPTPELLRNSLIRSIKIKLKNPSLNAPVKHLTR
jgi:hypothetical protein